MKVLAINGSPNRQGNTYHSLMTVGEQLQANGIDFEVLHVGHKLIRGCTNCGACKRNKDEKCSIVADDMNTWIQQMKQADGIILGAPVYFAGIPGTMKSFLDRAFRVSGASGNLFRHKVGAAITAARRTGGSMTFDSLNHYLNYSEMILATSNYWNIVHGGAPGEVAQDEEGMQIMKVLGTNMAWILKMQQEAKGKVDEPMAVNKVHTSFIR